MAEQPIQQSEQPMEQQQAAGVSPDDMRDAMAGESERNDNPDANRIAEVHERFVLNVMSLASGDEHDKIMAYLQSSDDSAQGFGRALFFILQAVKTGLETKDVKIPSELWLAQNGLVEQSARIIAVLASQAGIQMDENILTEGMNLAAEALAELDNGDESQETATQPPQQPQMNEQVMQQEQPVQPQGGGQMGGLLSQAGGM